VQEKERNKTSKEAERHCLPIVVACMRGPVGIVNMCFTKQISAREVKKQKKIQVYGYIYGERETDFQSARYGAIMVIRAIKERRDFPGVSGRGMVSLKAWDSDGIM
jgi:hypothetical protein